MGGDDAVARNDEREVIAGHGRADRASGAGVADDHRDVTIGADFTVGYSRHRLENTLLESRAVPDERKVEGAEFPVGVAFHLGFDPAIDLSPGEKLGRRI